MIIPTSCYNFSKMFVVSGLALAVAGCVSSSSDDGPEDPPERISGEVEVQAYSEGTINESEIETLVSESHNVFQEIFRSNIRYLDYIDEVSEGELRTEPLGSSIDYSPWYCPGGGSYVVRFDEGKPQLSSDDYMIFSAGDVYTFSAESCEFDGATEVIAQDGSVTTTVLAGFYDSFDEFASLSGSVKKVHKKNGLYDENKTLAYKDGDIERTIANGLSVSISGSSFKEKTARSSSSEYALENYDISMVGVGENSWSWSREWTMNDEGGFRLGIGSKGELFQASVSDLVYDRSKLSSGEYSLSDGTRTLTVEIADGVVTSSLDLNGDGQQDVTTSVIQD